MKLEVRSQAEQDVTDATEYYLREESPVSAARFLESVDASYDAILNAPRDIDPGQMSCARKYSTVFPTP